MKKTLITILATVLVCAGLVGGTLAWLTATSDTVVNTFTIGNIEITLTETDSDDDDNALANSYKMVPGSDITKDPVVTVKANSEKCWLLVKVEKTANFDTYMEFDMADGWTLVEGTTNVYSRVVDSSNADNPISVIKDNTVAVKDTVTKADATAAQTNVPKLTISAYAVQYENIDDAKTAWAQFSTNG